MDVGEISFGFDPASGIPVAGVCLKDTRDTLAAARYALLECYAHGAYSSNVIPEPKEMEATWFQRYYLDGVAYRLYSAAEHRADGLVRMFKISNERLNPDSLI